MQYVRNKCTRIYKCTIAINWPTMCVSYTDDSIMPSKQFKTKPTTCLCLRRHCY